MTRLARILACIGAAKREVRRVPRSADADGSLDTASSGEPRIVGVSASVAAVEPRAGRLADLPFPVHPHMLRHACGYKLANDGHDTRAIQHYLGHKNIVHTVRYTELTPDRLKGFWRD